MNDTNSDEQSLELGLSGFTYADLYDPRALSRLTTIFGDYLAEADSELALRFGRYHEFRGDDMQPEDISSVLTDAAPWLGRFLAMLFRIEAAWNAERDLMRDEDATIFGFRNEFIAPLAKQYKGVDVSTFDRAKILAVVAALRDIARSDARLPDDLEYVTARAAILLSGREHDLESFATSLRARYPDFASVNEGATAVELAHQALAQWCVLVQQDPNFDPIAHETWVSFKQPARTDVTKLVHFPKREHAGYSTWAAEASDRRKRDGFSLTDLRMGQRDVLYEIDHCIYCHDRNTDSCAKGMPNKKDGGFKTNGLGVAVTGCPLGEKISEMHVVKRQGDSIGALALIVVDNPMCPGTGHRICNDCMKGCIYQKTEPVNIPQIETNVLTDVLKLPWGFEIYGLLTRWNPLNVQRPHMLPYNGKKVLVAGLGPAGYTLSHYLLNEGFAVVGIDALKLEPLPKYLTGSLTAPPQPVRDFKTLYEDLDTRTVNGFGGVAEYGITVRWDKNFLKVIYLNLLRQRTFRAFGGVRFGGSITLEDAWSFGFDHVALATGAGKPSIIGIKNNLIRGIRKASDFLMALQLTGAAQDSSLANLQVRLPAGVIGGGLTAVDTATEVMAYYPRQVEKILRRYERLAADLSVEVVRARYDAEELAILDEALSHGRAVRRERERATHSGEQADFATLVQSWGGVTLFYRKRLEDSPAYRQNHEEVNEALQEGIEIAPQLDPLEALADEHGALCAVRFARTGDDADTHDLELPLKSLFIAAGTSPNIIYEQEHPGSFALDGKFFQRFETNNGRLEPIDPDATLIPKLASASPLTSYAKDGRFVSFYGDNHPVYAGNVVKAMASAKDGYPYIVNIFEDELNQLDPSQQPQREVDLRRFMQALDDALIATVVAVNRLTPTIIEVIVHSPMAALKFEPGQFYRVQNPAAFAPKVEGTVLSPEGLALTGAWVDKEQGLISLIALEMGASSRLLARCRPGDPLVVMGVTGTPTHILHNGTVLLVGGGLGNAVLFSIGKALRAAGNRVLYFAGYKRAQDVFKMEDIEAAADLVVWAVDPGDDVTQIPTGRPQDRSYVGNVVKAMVAYASGELGPIDINMQEIDELIVIGSDLMMAAVKRARSEELAPYLNPNHEAIGSINSPMQCMMKGVCAQCLCKHIDPDTGEVSFVYSCYNQDQPLDRVDFPNLRARLRQNSVQEKLSNLWLDHLLNRGAQS
ncbi:MAG: NADPH-dependent glutamate synthase beta subunit-like oxidoreductase/NAD(P)H-flavin reductase [Gammaproteobacteria bacterium]|jgi:NADPH-dependent glutamate synthase beta subunit-like oxidoreductase/NAD(P)H-flavin reductase